MSSSSYNSNYLDDEELAALAVITANTMAVVAVVQQRTYGQRKISEEETAGEDDRFLCVGSNLLLMKGDLFLFVLILVSFVKGEVVQIVSLHFLHHHTTPPYTKKNSTPKKSFFPSASLSM
jgi:hypothetical protein